MGKPEKNGPLGGSRRRCKDSNKMDFQEKGRGCGLDWAGSGQRWPTASCKCGNENIVSIK